MTEALQVIEETEHYRACLWQDDAPFDPVGDTDAPIHWASPYSGDWRRDYKHLVPKDEKWKEHHVRAAYYRIGINICDRGANKPVRIPPGFMSDDDWENWELVVATDAKEMRSWSGNQDVFAVLESIALERVQFFNGEVYGWTIESTGDAADPCEGCWGYYGEPDYCREEAISTLHLCEENYVKNEFDGWTDDLQSLPKEALSTL